MATEGDPYRSYEAFPLTRNWEGQEDPDVEMEARKLFEALVPPVVELKDEISLDNVKSIVFAIGKPATAAIRALDMEMTQLGRVTIPNVRSADISNPRFIDQALFRCDVTLHVAGPAIIVCAPSQLHQDRCYEVAKAVFQALPVASKIDVAIVTTLLDSKFSEFENSDDIIPPILRHIRSSAGKGKVVEDCAPLMGPSCAEGLTAAVLTHCEVHSLPAVCYLSVEENRELARETMFALQPVFDHLGLGGANKDSYRQSCIEFVREEVKRKQLSNPVYM